MALFLFPPQFSQCAFVSKHLAVPTLRDNYRAQRTLLLGRNIGNILSLLAARILQLFKPMGTGLWPRFFKCLCEVLEQERVFTFAMTIGPRVKRSGTREKKFCLICEAYIDKD